MPGHPFLYPSSHPNPFFFIYLFPFLTTAHPPLSASTEDTRARIPCPSPLSYRLPPFQSNHLPHPPLGVPRSPRSPPVEPGVT